MARSEALQAALQHHQSGNFKKAEDIYKAILIDEPDNFYALHYLGVLYTQTGNFNYAIEYIQKALQVNSADAHAYYNLGIALQGKGQFDDAVNSYQKALQLNPANADAYVNLGIIFKEKARFDDAITYYQKALELNPNLIAAQYNLGYLLQAQEQFDEAIIYYQDALKLNPNLAPAHYNLGYSYQVKGQLDEAIKYFEKALELNPDFPDAYNGLGVVFLEKGQIVEAERQLQKALQLNPAFVDAYNNLGSVFLEKGRLDEAINCYETALSHNPDFPETYNNLGYALYSQGKQDESLIAYDKATALKPNFIKARWAKSMSQIPIMYTNQKEIQKTRQSYHAELIKLADRISLQNPQDIKEAADAVGTQQPFFLAYQGMNDRELQQAYGDLVCKIMFSRYPKFEKNPPMPALLSGERLRIGIVSGFFYSHSNWKLRKGWIENIDKQRYSLYGYYTGKRSDSLTAIARQHFHRFIEDIHAFEDLCDIIRDDNLHVLIYPEIGMDPVTVKLAALRLAPVQCTSWGHPETSGLPTIDYYLSSDLMEPPDAYEHYAEKLVRLPNLSIYYTPFELSDIKANRNTFGLRQTSILYLCCQSLYKYLPQYDEIYPRIAQQAGNCQFIFISHKSKWITEQFKLRIKQTFNQYDMHDDDHIVILPRLDQEQYCALNRLADIYLDSIDWSGCNTTLEAIACNLPVVTLPGRFLRGRHGFGILTMMEVKETIASTLDEYIDLAARLGKDPEWRAEISEKMEANKHKVYYDKSCIRSLEDFFEKAVREFRRT